MKIVWLRSAPGLLRPGRAAGVKPGAWRPWEAARLEEERGRDRSGRVRCQAPRRVQGEGGRLASRTVRAILRGKWPNDRLSHPLNGAFPQLIPPTRVLWGNRPLQQKNFPSDIPPWCPSALGKCCSCR